MSATIKTYGFSVTTLSQIMGAELNVYTGDGLPYVLHADHQASHQYDEEKERALFEAHFSVADNLYSYWGGPTMGYWPRNENSDLASDLAREYDTRLESWLACAKARAEAAGCK